ncbi:MAG: 16S rRNA (uracil(1498)-N(3))-methyltransferase [Turicibacter sp.]|nr:16S rRNA (uracil(1498)-N(3))-methyltransferase [Turicibacter sp.]
MAKYFWDGSRVADETLHHLQNVLRVRVGEKFVLCDGAGLDCCCQVIRLKPFEFEVVDQNLCSSEFGRKITLFQAVIKSDKMEWVVQKAVELGVFAIVPVYTEYSAHFEIGKKIERYQKIAKSAAEQSMRGIIPQIKQPVNWANSLKIARGTKVVAHEKARHFTEFKTMRAVEFDQEEISLWIGPEGGFSPQETTQMDEYGLCKVSLTAGVLRAETAAAAALGQIWLVG